MARGVLESDRTGDSRSGSGGDVRPVVRHPVLLVGTGGVETSIYSVVSTYGAFPGLSRVPRELGMYGKARGHRGHGK